MFTITGPGSPSVLSKVVVSIEQHVDWIDGHLNYLPDQGFRRTEAAPDAQDGWVDHVNEVAAATLYPATASWYMGANIPGKPRVLMPYTGGVGAYRTICDDVAANDYHAFLFRS
ncbi:hypothetical protein ACIHDR_38785 [Nocardia sp. NPDC052278]|uniref:hypothetical protein n=1 Tax=unclassified Nocardia TaxID=2637762 RepID=UPI0036AC2C71